MYKIVRKRTLNPTVVEMCVDAPRVARRAEPGQFVILRTDAAGERIPLTVADYDREAGTVTIIFQLVGATTMKLGAMEVGDEIHDFVGPLGRPTETAGLSRVAVVGGGVGCAIAYPVAKKLHGLGVTVHSVVGFRTRDLVILEDEFRSVSDVYKLMSDDGSVGEHGLVTDALRALIESGERYDEVIAIGPLPMIDEGVRHQNSREHEPDNDRRHRHVRLLPPHRRREDEIRLRRRSRLRRTRGRF